MRVQIISFLTSLLLAIPLGAQDFKFEVKDQSFEEPLELRSQWGFHFGQLISPDSLSAYDFKALQEPGSWWNDSDLPRKGVATYQLTLTFTDEIEIKDLGLYVHHIFSSYRIYLNGEEVRSSGNPSSGDDYEPYREPWVIPLNGIKENEIEIVVHAANFSHNDSGMYYPLKLGKFEALRSDLQMRQGINLILAGGLFITGVVLLAFSLAYKQLNLQVLFFALFALSMTYRMIGADPYPLHALLPNYPFQWALHIEYLSIHTAALFGGLFVFYLYPEQSPNAFRYPFYLGNLISASLILALPSAVFTGLLRFYLFFILIYVIIFIYVIVKARLQKEDSSAYLVVALVVVLFWTIFQVTSFLNVRTIPYAINVVLVTAIIISCNLALFRTFFLKIKRSEWLQAELDFNRSKQTMLALISHEIKTPVATLQMTMEMLKASKDQPELLQKISNKLVDNSVNSITAIKQMVNDFILYMGKGDRKLQAYNIKEIAKNLEERFNLSISTKALSSNVYQTDMVTLEYIVSTLWSNALKFTPEGNKKPEIQIKEKGKVAIIEIKDFGIGMSPEEVEKFGSASVSVSDTQEVSGIGLYLAFELAKEIYHEVEVSSIKEEGTSVCIKLKRND